MSPPDLPSLCARLGKRFVEPVEHARKGEPAGADLTVWTGPFGGREADQCLAAGQMVVKRLRLALEEQIVLGFADQRRATDLFRNASRKL
jgi:hypothetical protein